jgi:CHAT domain-containing protein
MLKQNILNLKAVLKFNCVQPRKPVQNFLHGTAIFKNICGFTTFIIPLLGVVFTELGTAQTLSPGTPIDPLIVPDPNLQTQSPLTPSTETGTTPPGTNSINNPEIQINPCIFQCQDIKELEFNPQKPTLSVLNPYINPELKFTYSFISQLGVTAPKEVNINFFQIRDTARKIEKATGVKPAFIYISFVPVEILPESVSKQDKSQPINTIESTDSDEIEIFLVTGQGKPIYHRIPNVTKGDIIKVVQQFRTYIVAPQYRARESYLKPSQQLYNWLIKPIEKELQDQEIKNLVFLLDAGLRSTPMAALHDGEGFLVEKYSIGLMPSLTLTNTLYTDIKNSEILAMGVSQSTQGQEPLPAVPMELRTLVSKLWPGKLLLNQQTTVENLKSIRRQTPFGIVHLATHANFLGGNIDNSYIQLWEKKLRLNQIRELGLHKPQVEMLVLSACRSALGDETAELGFAGLAVLAGVKTSVASLWSVDDTGTAALMTKFYEKLKTAPVRADALRQAQLAMAKGQVYLQSGQLRGLEKVDGLVLPQESLDEPDQSLSHPYFWSGFTMVGNPW